MFGGLPVPGATVTASRGAEQVVTVTDQQGSYRLRGPRGGRLDDPGRDARFRDGETRT